MIGDLYLQIRAELGTALFSLTGLAHEAKAPGEEIQILQGITSGLRDPFLVVVVGEVKSGKSSLLNALFGKDFCRTDVLPATDRINLFKFGTEEQDVEAGPHMIERYRPMPFLRDFLVVDTPGTNTIVPEHQQITERFVPMADLVIFVFSITNPWGASTWSFLDMIHNSWMKNVVFVLQQADLRDPGEVEIVIQHLKQTALQKLGKTVPIFAVSAKSALLAKTTGIDKVRLWKESHFGQLEAHITEVVTHTDSRLGKLSSGCKTAKVVLDHITQRLRSAEDIIDRDEAQILKVKETMGWLREQTLRQIDGFLRSLEAAYDVAKQSGEVSLEKRLKFWSTIGLAFGKSDWMHDFQKKLELELRDAMRTKVEQILELLETDFKSVHQQLHDALVKGILSVPGGQLEVGLKEFTQARGKLIAKIELTLLEKMATDQIERQLESLFHETATWVRVPVGAAAAGGIAAGIAASMAMAAVADVTGVLAACTTVVGTFVAFSKRSKILATYRHEMSSKRKELVQAIGEHLKNAIELFYVQAGKAFQPLEAFCAVERKRFVPLLEQAEKLEKSLQRITTELKA